MRNPHKVGWRDVGDAGLIKFASGYSSVAPVQHVEAAGGA